MAVAGRLSSGVPWRRRYSAHIGHLFTELPFEQRFAAAARRGFAGVEGPEPYVMPAQELSRLLTDHGLVYVQCGVFGESAKREKGLAALPDRRADFREHLRLGLDYAAAIGCRNIHILAGARPAGIAAETLWSTYLENLAVAADAAKPFGITIIIEAMSPGASPGYYLNSPAMALEAIETVRRDNLRLMLDIFHTVHAGLDPLALIHRCGMLIAHLHIADHPGRHEPGTGTIDFDAIRAALDAVAYAGFIGCEYHPAAGTDSGLGWLPG